MTDVPHIIQVSAQEWSEKFSNNFHKVVFKEDKSHIEDRISYALLCVKGPDVIGYVTVRELDQHNVYWQWGGVVPAFRRSMTAVKAIESALEWQKKHSRGILTYVENRNLPMLKFYLAYGFLIIGTRTLFGKVMVDLAKDLHGN
jgi:ribosomal protein S18 acetylase RimI-like enzyme